MERTIKSDSATDRDANGQMPQGEGEREKHPPMSEDQLKRSLEHLRNLSVVKDHGLTVELVNQEGKNFVLIKEPTGKVVRRIQEQELWALKDAKETEKGQLLRRTA